MWFRRKSRASHDAAAFEQCYGGAVLKIKVEDTKRRELDCVWYTSDSFAPRNRRKSVIAVRTPSSI